MYVPQESQLDTIGYYDASYKRRYPTGQRETKTITLSDNRTISFIPTTLGYPNTDDQDYTFAIMRIAQEQLRTVVSYKKGERKIHPHLLLPLKVPTKKAIRYAGREYSARERKTFRDYLDRNRGTTITGQLKIAKDGSVADRGFSTSLFAEIIYRGQRTKNGRIAEVNYIWPSRWFMSQLYYHFFKPTDQALHLRFGKNPIAKSLRPLLDQGFYAAEGGAFSKSYRPICQLLTIQPQKHLSLIKQQLNPAHCILKREQYIERWEYRRSADGTDWIVTWWPGDKWRSDQDEIARRRQAYEEAQSPTPELLDRPTNHSERILQDLRELLQDSHSDPYFKQLIQENGYLCVESWLRETIQANLEGRIRTNRRRYFTDLAERLRRKEPRHNQEPPNTANSAVG